MKMGSAIVREVIINKEPVELYKIIKFENLAMSGGEAKHLIQEGLVLVNGVIETRKRKKIYQGDLIEVHGETLRIHFQKGGGNGSA